ncbi:ferredoxin--NADP reductase [Rhodovarius lipocyclicus]|uniref:ferredoxin--NADP reductase n=1 Tax=Rhodovarius lipocyclicus TaxID=268410 RepID=UPI001359E6A4|nr:ferredoxin--NADP reductase [Rhodovarius lipocyclicus]
MSETATQTIPAAFYGERVTWVHHWTDSLFSFRCTRDPALRFVAGQFCMIGLMVDGKPLTRAYSVVSPPWDEELEFLSIKVQNGPLTSRLQHIKVGDTVLIGRKPVGTLIAESLLPGRNLWMMCTGTGLAPFMSVIRDPDTYDKFDRVIVAHTVRNVNELAYRQYMTEELPQHELLGELAAEKLVYAPAVTREPFPFQGRITDRIRTGQLYTDTGLEPLDPAKDRVMLCGSEVFNTDMEKLLEEAGFEEGTNNKPGTYVLEKAFVTK